jgi:hypothetical protein
MVPVATACEQSSLKLTKLASVTAAQRPVTTSVVSVTGAVVLLVISPAIVTVISPALSLSPHPVRVSF